MARVLIGSLSSSWTGLRCLECRRQMSSIGGAGGVFRLVEAQAPPRGKWARPFVLCMACAAEIYEGQEVTNGVDVSIDPEIVEWQTDGQFREIGTEGTGGSSPRWVSCPKCKAYRGDPCRAVLDKGKYCAERVEANRKRLAELETWAIFSTTPCHGTRVLLCWRSAENELSWFGVPCFAKDCGKTYQFCAYADELVPERVQAERLHPQLVEMVCWATEETDPWES